MTESNVATNDSACSLSTVFHRLVHSANIRCRHIGIADRLVGTWQDSPRCEVGGGLETYANDQPKRRLT